MQQNLSHRQIEIIAASGKILMEKGILGLTTKNLAQEMNFSESALYRHFKDKEAIISVLINYLSANITSRFEMILASNRNPEEKFVAIFKSQFEFFKNNPHFIIIVLSDGLMDNSEALKSDILKLMQTNAKVFADIIKNGQELNHFNTKIETDYLVHFTMGTFRLLMLKWKLANFEFDLEKQGLQTMNSLLELIKTK